MIIIDKTHLLFMSLIFEKDTALIENNELVFWIKDIGYLFVYKRAVQGNDGSEIRYVGIDDCNKLFGITVKDAWGKFKDTLEDKITEVSALIMNDEVRIFCDENEKLLSEIFKTMIRKYNYTLEQLYEKLHLGGSWSGAKLYKRQDLADVLGNLLETDPRICK